MDIGELRKAFIFDGLTDTQLRELLVVGEEYPFVEGQEIFKEGDPADCWWVLLEGQVHLERLSGRESAVGREQQLPGHRPRRRPGADVPSARVVTR